MPHADDRYQMPERWTEIGRTADPADYIPGSHTVRPGAVAVTTGSAADQASEIESVPEDADVFHGFVISDETGRGAVAGHDGTYRMTIHDRHPVHLPFRAGTTIHAGQRVAAMRGGMIRPAGPGEQHIGTAANSVRAGDDVEVQVGWFDGNGVFGGGLREAVADHPVQFIADYMAARWGSAMTAAGSPYPLIHRPGDWSGVTYAPSGWISGPCGTPDENDPEVREIIGHAVACGDDIQDVLEALARRPDPLDDIPDSIPLLAAPSPGRHSEAWRIVAVGVWIAHLSERDDDRPTEELTAGQLRAELARNGAMRV